MAPPQGIFRTADRRGELSHGGRGFYIGPTGCNSGSDIEQQTPNLSKAFVSGTLLPIQGPTIRPGVGRHGLGKCRDGNGADKKADDGNSDQSAANLSHSALLLSARLRDTPRPTVMLMDALS
jgi:hypothetical protein